MTDKSENPCYLSDILRFICSLSPEKEVLITSPITPSPTDFFTLLFQLFSLDIYRFCFI